MDELAILEQRKIAIQQQVAFELGKIEGRIELLKEQAAAVKKGPAADGPPAKAADA